MADKLVGGLPTVVTGVYISFPFCRQKCTFCNFASSVAGVDSQQHYVAALTAEIRGRPPGWVADTVYLGGGTPSLLEPHELERLLAPLPGSPWRETTIEVAPGDVSPERARAWVRLGVNRVSLGVQSLDRRVAAASGRKHTPEIVAQEIGMLRAAGIRRINIDLIAGLAHQTEQTWEADLDGVERLQVEHVSVYMLEVDDDSRLGGEIRTGGRRYGAQSTPSEDAVTAMYLRAVERLRAIGIERYEISNFARPGAESLHNLKYWNLEPYVGFGADAHSFDGSRRWWNVRTAGEYVERFRAGRSPRLQTEQLDSKRLFEDRLLTGLRTAEGVCLMPEDPRPRPEALDRLVAQGWIERPGPDRIRLTDEGVLFSDSVLAELILG